MADEEEVPGHEGQVSCEFCRKNIPRSEAFQPEGEEYVAYFCGLECYQAWRKEAEQDSGDKASD
jgi:hypothetical protein